MNGERVKTHISNLQFFVLVIAPTTAFGHFVYTHLGIVDAGRDVWLSLLVGFAVGAVILFGQLSQVKHTKQSLADHVMSAMGKWLGGFVSLLYAAYFMLVTAATLKIVIDFMSIVFPTTPAGVFLFSILVIAAWGCYKGIEVLARTVLLVLPFLMLLGMSASVLSVADKDFQQILPILDDGWYPVFDGSLIFVAMFCELVAFRTIGCYASRPEKLPKQGLVVTGILLIMFLAPVTGPIMLFGENLARSLAFPTYAEIQYIHIKNIIERFDIVGVLLWTFGSFFRTATFLFAASKMVADVFKFEDNAFIIPMSTIIAGISLSLVRSSREDLYAFLDSAYLYISFAFGVGLPVLMALAGWIKGRLKKPKSGHGISAN